MFIQQLTLLALCLLIAAIAGGVPTQMKSQFQVAENPTPRNGRGKYGAENSVWLGNRHIRYPQQQVSKGNSGDGGGFRMQLPPENFISPHLKRMEKMKGRPDSGSEHRIHWLFQHYHKTGHNLVLHLTRIFSKYCDGCSIFFFPNAKRANFQPFIKQLDLFDISVLTATDLQFDWDSSFVLQNDTFRLIHFVRNPFDMVMSAFLYHAQDSPPEQWLEFSDFDPCAMDEYSTVDKYAKKLGEFAGNVTGIQHLVWEAQKMCVALHKKYRAKSYNKELQGAKQGDDLFDGIRLEAARSLLHHPGGDILRMGANSVWQSESRRGLGMKEYLTNFPVGDKERFLNASRDLFDYLMGPPPLGAGGERKSVFFDCISKDAAIGKWFEYAFVDSAPTSDGNRPHHVTSGFMESAEKAQYIQRLEQDPVLGPLLSIVKKAVFL